MIAAARLQQRQVAIDSRGALPVGSGRQLFHQLRARREAGRVLIDVVRRAVEMRDARPRDARLRVVVHRIAVIRLQQVEVDVGERVGRDRLSLLDEAMRLQLVVCEEHLRVEGGDDAVDGVLQQHDALAIVGRLPEHVLEEQHLAERRRHLGHENRVRRVHERLVRVRQQRVHRMPHLVGEGEHRVQRIVVVQQHVRMDAVHRRRVGAAALSRILVHINPVAEQHVAQLRAVLLAERRHRRRQPVQHVLVRILAIEVDERNRRVVGVVRREPEHAFAQPVIPAQRLGARLGRFDQVLDDRRRNVVAVQRGLERRPVAARLRVKPVALHDGVIQRCIGVDVRFVQLVILAERCRAVGLMTQKIPERLEVIDAMPRNPSGKVPKHELRARIT